MALRHFQWNTVTALRYSHMAGYEKTSNDAKYRNPHLVLAIILLQYYALELFYEFELEASCLTYLHEIVTFSSDRFILSNGKIC